MTDTLLQWLALIALIGVGFWVGFEVVGFLPISDWRTY